MAPCPTVKKKDDKAPGGFVVINESDFNEEIDELFEEAATPVDPVNTGTVTL